MKNINDTSYNKRIGRIGEDLATSHLEKRGLEILERNFRTRQGEIDLIALEGDLIVFVEVKTRLHFSAGSPLEAVDELKRDKLRAMAEVYLAKMGWMEREVRFDVFTVIRDKESRKWKGLWIKQAF